MAQKPKKDAILAAAEELFISRGFAKVSMDDIASRTPVSKPTLYANFKDKGALFTAVIEGRCQQFLGLLEIDAEESPEKALRRIGRLYLQRIFAPEALAMVRVI